MCGIAGILGADSESARPRLARMLRAMAHRGPDGRGTLEYARGAAGMVRLALVDLSPRGQQPLWTVDGKVAILFNGEIYNFRELRADLEKRGHVFTTTTDTEVILALYVDRGLAFTEALRGMYALAIFDFRERGRNATPDVILGRGPFGMKPLYVAAPTGAHGPLIFASELRTMLASGLVEKRVDREAVREYLRYGFLVQPRTMIEGVRMLDPGTLERHSPGLPVERRVTTIWTEPSVTHRSLPESARALRRILDDSIRLHALADAPVGAFLSGGVDSAGIVALMRPHVETLKTYTLRFVDVPGADEASEAQAIALAAGCEHVVVDVSPEEVARVFPRFCRDIDQPSIDGLNTWLVSRAAAHDVKAVLSGLGGDEWFNGYPTALRMLRAEDRLEHTGVRVLARLAQGLPLAVNKRVPRALRERAENLAARRSPLAMWIHGHKVFSPASVERLLGADPTESMLDDDSVRAAADASAPWWPEAKPLDLAMMLDARIYMGSQLLRDSDATSMAHSLELRAPYVDREVADFARHCSGDLRATLAHDGERAAQKRVLVEALRGAIPDEVAKRKKRGFSLPYEHWLKGALRPLLFDVVHPSSVRARGVLDPFVVGDLFEHLEEGDVLYPKMWSLLTLELWWREVIDAPLESFDDVAGDSRAPPRVGAVA